MSLLSDRVAIVTGASSGIGEATAVALGRRNARVVVAARRPERLDALAARIVDGGGHAMAVQCDVADRSQVEALAEATRSSFGRIDLLINNAGVMPLAPMAKCRVDDWERTIDVNVKGVLYCIGAVLPTMLEQKSGHIVNVSSVAGRVTFPIAAVYCGSKFAVHAISDALRSELAERGQQDGTSIRVTIVAPGVVTTELEGSITDDETRSGVGEYYRSIPGPLQSDDIANAIMYALESPPHVDVSEVLIRPTMQVR